MAKLPVRCNDYPAAFEYWRRQSVRNGFAYACPQCGGRTDVRTRIAKEPQACAYCGGPITTSGIDAQLDGLEPQRRREVRRFNMLQVLLNMDVFLVGIIIAVVWWLLSQRD